jgi:hypothetical protein
MAGSGNLAFRFFYILLKFTPKIRTHSAPRTKQHGAVVEVPKDLVQCRGLLPKANPDGAGSVLAESSGSNGNITAGERSSVDHASTEDSIDEIPTSRTEPGATNPVIALPPVNRNDAQTNLDSGISARREDSARARGLRVRNGRRSSLASRIIDVKRRLVELWHQSLEQSEKSRSWTTFSNLKRGVHKKSA